MSEVTAGSGVDETAPCQMQLFGRRDPCGKPATLGIPGEAQPLIPICEDCIAESGATRRYLRLLSRTGAPDVG